MISNFIAKILKRENLKYKSLYALDATNGFIEPIIAN